jgi:parallel beta-helix repeat protein
MGSPNRRSSRNVETVTMRVRQMLMSTGLLLLPLRAALAGATLLVPQQFATIQAAVDASANGDTILVQGGVYPENVSVTSRDSLMLRGKGKVTIDAQGVGVGLSLTFCTNSRVERIGVSNAGVYGINLVQTHGTTLFKCRVDHSGDDGVHVQTCTTLTIDSCTITESGDTGITLGDGAAAPADACHVVHNKLSGTVTDGVQVTGNGNSIIGNVSTQAQFYAYRIGDGSASSQNVFAGNKALQPQYGIDLHGSGNLVSGNTIVHPAQDGIDLLDGSDDFVAGNRIISAAYGISVGLTTTDIMLSKNTVIHPAQEGLSLIGYGFVADGNVVKGSGHDGIALYGSDGLCANNRSTGNAEDGFDLSGGNNLLSGNVGKGNGAFDLHDEGVLNDVDGTNSFKTSSP